MKIKVIDNNTRKEKLLKALYDKWKVGYDETNFGRQVTDLGRSLSVLELTDIAKLNKSEIEKLMISISSDGFACMYQSDPNTNQKNHLYLITEIGKKAAVDNHYHNLSAVKNQTTLFEIFGVIIGILGFILALTTFLIQRNNIDPQIEKLQKQIDILKSEISHTNKK
ncbi:hypothetical protein [Mucilaginibacter arboris]|uniref:Uncharacterized protein n=1 Tax=Mucilaginibacter arboris TaxID=2682090 RepID=A0A7K1T2J5_9SPHI|nr:hypothetical protein [Mucilaginibacter arboris]MVN23530.1 hypothetical protein [Mucilaginibacter arboris]